MVLGTHLALIVFQISIVFFSTQNEYMVFPGMYPRAAGLIASNGPYNDVKDIYKIEGLTERDKALFRKYDKNFTVNPPGRMFDERINQRVST